VNGIEDDDSETRALLLERQRIFDLSLDLICTVDARGRFRKLSASAARILGFQPEELIDRRVVDLVHPNDAAHWLEGERRVLAGTSVSELEGRFVRKDGGIVDLSWSAQWSADTEVSYCVARDVTSRRRAEALRDSQREILQMIASDAELGDVLRRIGSLVEGVDRDLRCSIAMLDVANQRVGEVIAPRVPAALTLTIAGAALAAASEARLGSCPAALARGEAVISSDIASDPLWADNRNVALAHDLRACWSVPVFVAGGQVVATIDVYYAYPRQPSARELDLLQAAAGHISVAVAHARAHAQLRESFARLELDVTERIETETRLQHYLSQLAFLADAARKVNSVLTIEELLQVITDIARDLVNAHIAVGTLVRENTLRTALNSLSLSTKYDGAPRSGVLEAIEAHNLPATAGPTRRPRAAHDDSPPADVGTAIATRGELRVPLVTAGGRRTGELRVADKRTGDFTHNDERVLAQLADLAAVGIENARLYAELEARVRHRTQELEQSNRELEAFSYSVSHDLRGPLRAIAGFTGLLRARHYETIEADSRRYIDRILAGTERMSSLIDDLLELARVTRVEIRREAVDLSALTHTIIVRLRERAPERDVEVVVEAEQTVHGDLRLMEIVLDNLLDNAWKFTAGCKLTEIRFGSKTIGRERAFYVQDNGVGFDPRYAANLFGVFQRLHAVSEFPGTGVGLATVQRIVQRHGGRVWAEAEVDRGASFFFTIARA
jgi:PAS domain S-box-containing protein